MEVEFLAGNLEKYIPLLIKSLPSHSQVPVLSNILLSATKKGFTISATDLEFGIQISIPAKITEEGAVTVPGREFLDTISMMIKEKVSIKEEKELLLLKSPTTKISFQTIAQEEFPSIFQEKGDKVYDFEKKEMEDIFPQLSFAVANDDTRPELTGILFSQQEEETHFVATDGFRLSVVSLKNSKILPSGTKIVFFFFLINEAMSLKEAGKITLFIQEKSSQIIFETENIILIGRIIRGEFPNYQKVIPKETRGSMVVDRDELLSQVRLASVFARESANIIYLTIKDGSLVIKSKSSGVGEQESVIEGQQEGEGVEVAFNAKFLMDLLKNLDCKEVNIQTNSSVEPVLFTDPKNTSFLHVIMPVRVQE